MTVLRWYLAGTLVSIASPTLASTRAEVTDSVDAEYCTTTHKTDESGCKADKAHTCVWCMAKAVPSMCYDENIAKQLPRSVFKCEFSSFEYTRVQEETV